MKQTIDIELLKKNPEFFFSQLPENAKEEITEFLRFVFFKYKINTDIKKTSYKKLIENPIQTKTIKTHSREELHER